MTLAQLEHSVQAVSECTKRDQKKKEYHQPQCPLCKRACFLGFLDSYHLTQMPDEIVCTAGTTWARKFLGESIWYSALLNNIKRHSLL